MVQGSDLTSHCLLFIHSNAVYSNFQGNKNNTTTLNVYIKLCSLRKFSSSPLRSVITPKILRKTNYQAQIPQALPNVLGFIP